ncbi:MAG: 50S ribosomal protein L25 [Anaerolineae bacterium]
MEQRKLEVEPRPVVGKKVRRLRAEGWIPAVLYGDVKPMPLQIRGTTWRRFTASAGRGLIELHVQGQQKPYLALVREVQRDPITHQVWHVDFQQVSLTEILRVEVPVTVVGASPVVERGDGILLTGLTHLEVECLPSAIPSGIEVDASALKAVGDSITVADLVLPEGVKVIAEADEMILTVVPAGVPEEEGAVAAEGEPELIRKGKPAEKEEEAEE